MMLMFMSQFRRARVGLVWTVLVTLTGVGCSRPDGVPTDQSTVQAEHRAPFNDEGTKSGDAASSASSAGSSGAVTDPQNNLPFHDSQNLPGGTLLTVRLKNPLYAENIDSHTSFEAVVVEPVVVDGNVLIPRGASVAGRVESARMSKVKPDRGYMRLALQSVQVGGKNVPVQTASLFARQAPVNDNSESLIHLERGRRLTFRLTETVYTANQRAQSGH
jgi:hypothetical protein